MSDRNLRLRIIMEGLDRLTKPLKSITGASAGARKDLAATRDELKNLAAAQRDLDRFKAIGDRLKVDSGDLAEARARVEQLAREMAEAEQPTKKLTAAFDRATRQAQILEQRHDAGGRELQELSRKLEAAGVDVTDLARHEDQLAMRTYEANKALKRQQEQLDKIGRAERQSAKLRETGGQAMSAGGGMMAAGFATGVPIAYAAKQAMTLESAMADVRKVVNFPTPQAFSRMSDDILTLSERIPMSAAGLAQIVAAGARANIPRQELLAFAEDAAKMGVAFDSSAEDAGNMMAKWRTAFAMTGPQVVTLADQINALTNSFGGDVGAVSDMVTRIGPLGKVAGLAAPQIASVAQLMSAVGIESEIGATGIKNMMLALTKGEAATKQQSAAFEKLGLDAVEMAGAMQKDAGGAIITVMDRIAKLPKEAQAGVLDQLFGSESVAAIAPMLTSLDKLKANFKLVGDAGNYAGSMNREFLSRIATTEGATGLAGNSLQALNITLGAYLLPTVVSVSQFVSRAAQSFRGWAKENPRLAKGLMIFLSVGAGLLILVGGLAVAFGALSLAAAPLGIALAPLLAIIAAVAAVAGAAYLLYQAWGPVKAFFVSLWADLKTAFDGGLWGVLALLIRWAGALLSTIWNGLTTAFSAIVAALPGIASGLFTALKNILWNGLLLIPRLFFQFGVNTIRGLIDGLFSMFPNVKAAVTRLANMLPESVRKALGIHSPSRVFHQIGGFMMEGLDGGLYSGRAAPISRMKGIASDISRAVALGTAAPALAASPSPAAARGPAAPLGPITITINQLPGQNSQDIARAVADALEKLRRGGGGGRSSYADEQDYGGFAT